MIGSTLGVGGRYRILSLLGDGGMGSVYRAVDTSGREVALKILHPHLAEDKELFARFRREAETCAALAHPHIVQIFHFEAGLPPFLVMELIEGASIARLVQNHGPIAADRAAGIGRHIASALSAAHGAGIVHRDVTPANVVVRSTPAGDVAKLVDFGIAKLVEGIGVQKLTASGVIVGTPNYMAPEQIRGRNVDARTDVYGLGATLYYAVSGVRPFERLPRDAVAEAVCQSMPERLIDVRPDIDPAFASVVERAIAKRPEDRFASTAEMGEALANWLARGSTVTPAAPVSTLRGPDGSDEGMPKVGDVVDGKLRIEAIVGQGGMGIVYAARHEVLDQPVALKVLLPIPDDDTRQRFVKEAKLVARMSGEHVCRVLDAGMLPCGQPFIAMELLIGRDLAQLLRQRGPLPIAEAVGYVLQALEAIAQAHGAGIVHRDLKPSNLFLSEKPDGDRVVKVLDFGISKSAEPLDVALTQTGTTMGSPPYMSPEQAQSSRDVDVRSDVWAIGVVLYELLTGVSPFGGTTLGEVLHKIFLLDAEPPTVRRPDLPASLQAIVLRCLRKPREERFANVYELAVALAPFAGFDPLLQARLGRIAGSLAIAEPSARAVSAIAPAPPRRELVALFAALLAIGLVAGAVGLWRIRARSAAPPTAAQIVDPPPVVTVAPIPDPPAPAASASVVPIVASVPSSSAPQPSKTKPTRPPTSLLDKRH
jgi:eukaryotic-like serine/threonine-protein kinase